MLPPFHSIRRHTLFTPSTSTSARIDLWTVASPARATTRMRHLMRPIPLIEHKLSLLWRLCYESSLLISRQQYLKAHKRALSRFFTWPNGKPKWSMWLFYLCQVVLKSSRVESLMLSWPRLFDSDSVLVGLGPTKLLECCSSRIVQQCYNPISCRKCILRHLSHPSRKFSKRASSYQTMLTSRSSLLWIYRHSRLVGLLNFSTLNKFPQLLWFLQCGLFASK